MTDDDVPDIPLGHGSDRDRDTEGLFGDGDDGSADSGDDSGASDPGDGRSADSGDDSGASDPGDGGTGDDGTNSGSATDDEETEPVEVLVQLAKRGEIDPWDTDIVAVTDAFLAELEERDLRTSGRALFYASVLLRMKSDAMLEPDEPESEEPEPWETAFRDGAGPEAVDDDDDFDPVDALEAEMDRRLERRSTRGSPETLDELVRELREAERGSRWKESREYDTSGETEPSGTQTLQYRGGSDSRPEPEPGEGDVTETTHEEDIETVIGEVRTALTRQYDNGRREVLFREVRTAGGSPVQTYLALLFLAHRGEVRLRQDDLFGDLWVQDPTAPTVGDEAVAD
ncbi:segregation/condensation protein A [Halobaculum sp. MBLA0143]|uniref:segregation/condensation protein A n=1 Tax=Halobaculum sp. MBLA0143 TaxID=3079933 RepID=UPI003524C40E